MIIGHVGIAFAARRAWPKAPLGWLLIATFACDIWRIALDGHRYGLWIANLYSHALPWCLMLAVVFASVTWTLFRNGRVALVVGVVVLSHVALDMISGWKPLWIGGPIGLDLQHVEQAEFALEALIAITGWRLLRRTTVPRWQRGWLILAVLLLVEAGYLRTYYDSRPPARRCWTYPFSPCWTKL